MKRKLSIKCGEFWFKDGIIIKRPGKRFRLPELPEKYMTPYPEISDDRQICAACTFIGTGEYEEAYDRIDRENALKKRKFQEKICDKYALIKFLYYLQEGKKIAIRNISRIARGFDKIITAIVHEYE